MKRRPGFTLVEVLVVIAVIALLLGVLVPVIADVQSSSRRVQGQTNLRTMAMAARRLGHGARWSVPTGSSRRDG